LLKSRWSSIKNLSLIKLWTEYVMCHSTLTLACEDLVWDLCGNNEVRHTIMFSIGSRIFFFWNSQKIIFKLFLLQHLVSRFIHKIFFLFFGFYNIFSFSQKEFSHLYIKEKYFSAIILQKKNLIQEKCFHYLNYAHFSVDICKRHNIIASIKFLALYGETQKCLFIVYFFYCMTFFILPS
jgi:hypothetical protein